MSTDAAGRVIVTGAAGAIGRAIVEELAAGGFEVVACDLAVPERLGHASLAADVTDPRGRELIESALDGAAGLVNAAGVNLSTELDAIDDAHWDRTVDINVKAPFYLTRAAGTRLRDGGAVVNIASTAAHLARIPASTAYAASKAALVASTKALARAYAPRVRVNAVSPGLIETPMQQQLLASLAAERGVPLDTIVDENTRGVALARMGTPAEVAAVVRFLVSADASYLTGTTIDIDGGLSMR